MTLPPLDARSQRDGVDHHRHRARESRSLVDSAGQRGGTHEPDKGEQQDHQASRTVVHTSFLCGGCSCMAPGETAPVRNCLPRHRRQCCRHCPPARRQNRHHLRSPKAPLQKNQGQAKCCTPRQACSGKDHRVGRTRLRRPRRHGGTGDCPASLPGVLPECQRRSPVQIHLPPRSHTGRQEVGSPRQAEHYGTQRAHTRSLGGSCAPLRARSGV
jgi:hypothetical protein